MSHLLNQLKSNVLVADGAIGTIFYSEGLDTCPNPTILLIQIRSSGFIVLISKLVQTSFKRIRMVLTLKIKVLWS